MRCAILKFYFSLPTTVVVLSASTFTYDRTLTAAPIAVSSYSYGANAESQPQATTFQGGTISDFGNLKLTDGNLATGTWNDGTNVGFRNDTDNGNPQPQVTFDLGAGYDVSTVDIWTVSAFLGSNESVSISSSTDGISYSAPVTVNPIVWTGGFTNNNLQKASIDVSSLPSGQFIRVEIFDPGQWMMINEIQFDGVLAGPDTTPPTLLPNNIIDDQGGASVNENTSVTYTVTFSEDIDASTVSSADFSNAGTAPITIGVITETAPGLFTIQVTPTAIGTLQLQIPINATIKDTAGLSMVTTSAVVDDTTITITVAPPDNTPPTPNPMTFATAPTASTATSITMVATAASDNAGVEYLFTEISGNPGGSSSNWQSSPVYEDIGLTTGLQYTYTVTARDLSSNQNETLPSAEASATAQTPITPPTITAPTTRHIVQRTATNIGAFEVKGSYGVGTPERIEARAAVMTGSGNNGITTAWQIIDATPSNGSFSGTLNNVPAGGWYQLEVRSVINGTPSNAAVLEKVGVGDIFVTAGQSNSANHSPGGYVPADDRVCARTTVTGSSWVHATDPIPIASGSGGSIWTRFGDQLAATLDIPIGFIAVGVGGTQVASWVPGAGNYNNRLKPAVQSLPINGFRAALWHQGESDSIGGVSAVTHASRLSSMMSQSRIDAGWDIPWYICEASWHPGGSYANQQAVAAGQRLAVHGDPLAFLGETTDDMHLKGSALHFDIPRQLERSQQYTIILTGDPTVTPVNGNFEDNRTSAITGLNPLTDGTSELVVLTGTTEPRPLGWRIMSAGGLTAADGSNGFHNPSNSTYAGAIDTINDGVLPNMDGKHVAVLDGGSGGNYFLHSTRAQAKANTTYTLTVALGMRDNSASFGTARLEITANGLVVASNSYDKTAIDALQGSDASGTFTDVTVSWTTGSAVASNQPLAIRIVKVDGAGTVLDFDNVRFSATFLNTFSTWIDDFSLPLADQDFGDDSDGDDLSNGIEAWFGTHPGQFNQGLGNISSSGLTTTFTHPVNTSIPRGITSYYEWSPNLSDWYRNGEGPSGGPVITFTSSTSGNTVTVTATASGSAGTEKIFLRAGVTQD